MEWERGDQPQWAEDQGIPWHLVKGTMSPSQEREITAAVKARDAAEITLSDLKYDQISQCAKCKEFFLNTCTLPEREKSSTPCGGYYNK